MAGIIIPDADLSIDAYHASDYVSNTKLQGFDELGPAGYKGRFIARDDERPDTAAFRLGRLAEDAVCGRPLPPVAPAEIADPAPEPKPWSARRKACKEWLEAHPGEEPPAVLADGPAPGPTPWNGNRAVCKAWLAEHPDAITPAEHALLVHIRDAVDRNNTAREIISASGEQVSMRGVWPGLPGIQARPDWLLVDHPFLGDVSLDMKTCDSLAKFRRSVHSFGYMKQAGMVDLLGEQCGLSLTQYLLAVEKQYPHRAQMYELRDVDVATGRAWVERKLGELAEHYVADHWPPVVHDVEILEAPVWGEEAAE